MFQMAGALEETSSLTFNGEIICVNKPPTHMLFKKCDTIYRFLNIGNKISL